jgi:hypothetical protein
MATKKAATKKAAPEKRRLLCTTVDFDFTEIQKGKGIEVYPLILRGRSEKTALLEECKEYIDSSSEDVVEVLVLEIVEVLEVRRELSVKSISPMGLVEPEVD